MTGRSVLSAERDGWPAVRLAVFSRDRGCIATDPAKVGRHVAVTTCKDQWGNTILPNELRFMQQDHVKAEPMAGRKAPDDEAHLVTVCPAHHETWATANRPAEREYLKRLYPEVWANHAAT